MSTSSQLDVPYLAMSHSSQLHHTLFTCATRWAEHPTYMYCNYAHLRPFYLRLTLFNYDLLWSNYCKPLQAELRPHPTKALPNAPHRTLPMGHPISPFYQAETTRSSPAVSTPDMAPHPTYQRRKLYCYLRYTQIFLLWTLKTTQGRSSKATPHPIYCTPHTS